MTGVRWERYPLVGALWEGKTPHQPMARPACGRVRGVRRGHAVPDVA